MTVSPVLEDELGQWRARALDGARAAVGIAEDAPPSMRDALHGADSGWYALVALSALVVVADMQSLALAALGPEVTATLGISTPELTAALIFKSVVVAAAGLPAAAIAQRHGGRGRLCVAAALLWTVAALTTTFVVSLAGLLILLAGSGVGVGALRAVQPSLLVDSLPPSTRLRALSLSQAATSAGIVLASLTVYVAMSGLGLTWRGAFLAIGLVSLAVTALATRLRDPGYGTLDVAVVAAAARRAGSQPVIEATEDPATRLGALETIRRVLLIPMMTRLLVADLLIGGLLTPASTYLAFLLRSRWDVGPGERALVIGALPLLAIVAVLALAPTAERTFRHDPARLMRAAGILIGGAAVVLIAAVSMPWLIPALVLIAVMQAGVALTAPIVTMSVLSVVPPRMRPVTAALHAAVLFGAGGLSGVMLVGSMDRRFGTAVALGALALPALAGAALLGAASRLVDGDIDRFLEETIEEEELREVHAAGRHLPMLACRHVDFSYGSLQVLFDVNFNVEQSEMVALLGTNGAGKSTLLRVVSGLGFPSRGSVRFDGADVTYLDAERRLALGVSQVPGGRAVFPPLTVVENLRIAGFTLGRHRAAMDRGIEATFAAFPQLAQRRNHLAGALSGGEQQMLGLGKAFILEPRLLLIDELSLGLAPKVVGELLDMVRSINQRGTAVVLVEQSVNVALSLVERAYFMEKGEVRFEGRSADLLDRPDLLRSVFLEGATGNSTGPTGNGAKAPVGGRTRRRPR